MVDTKATTWTLRAMLGEEVEKDADELLKLLLKHHASVPREVTQAALKVTAGLNALALADWNERQRVVGLATWRHLFLESRLQAERTRRLKKMP